jgi:hypothetical protein
MHIVAQHRILDEQKLLAMDAEEVANGGPDGVHGCRLFLPSEDHTTAVCVWEAESVDALRGYLDPLTTGVTENAYFAVDEGHAMGMPEPLAPGAAAS